MSLLWGKERLAARGEGLAQEHASFHFTWCCLLNFHQKRDGHWPKPAFSLNLSSAFLLLQTCSCLLWHRKIWQQPYLTYMTEHNAMGIPAPGPQMGFYCCYHKAFNNFKWVFLGYVSSFGRGEVKILLVLSHIAETETWWVLHYPFWTSVTPKDWRWTLPAQAPESVPQGISSYLRDMQDVYSHALAASQLQLYMQFCFRNLYLQYCNIFFSLCHQEFKYSSDQC